MTGEMAAFYGEKNESFGKEGNLEKLVALGNSLLHGLQLREMHNFPIIAMVIVVLRGVTDVVGAFVELVIVPSLHPSPHPSSKQ
ncbi:unnamed protein product [Symbiodinium sp. CCMP2592]|nr:unnamed protein product [Symbiodinium sp. CCMP2592]